MRAIWSLLIPSDYVPQESERIALYQELDSIERELDLQNFRSRLVDRFGKIPPVTAELLRIPRLRRLARRLGIEKVALKQDVMYLYFVDESNKAYYQSPMFGKLLQYLQAQHVAVPPAQPQRPQQHLGRPRVVGRGGPARAPAGARAQRHLTLPGPKARLPVSLDAFFCG